MTIAASTLAIWLIVASSTVCVIIRPRRLPEALWAVAGAASLVAFGLMTSSNALAAIAKGTDVYLFLIGMMLLAEIARREGVFDWLAALAVGAAKGSSRRLFVLVYVVGIVVTTLLSNDATAVVLTPAVFAAARKARVDPLPYLFICAMVANAASFVLPISNPANLVVFGRAMPSLAHWLARFLLPSLASIAVTFVALRWAERARLGAACAIVDRMPQLSAGGKLAAGGIASAALVLLTVSAFNIPLGLPTAVVGGITSGLILAWRREAPWPLLKHVSWSIVPLVAGLFVFVEALAQTGVIAALSNLVMAAVHRAELRTSLDAGVAVAILDNLMNNLPAGLIASAALSQAHAAVRITDCVLIGVDIGPNLSVTGSLATILWLTAIRREGEDVDFRRFLRVGIVVMPPALFLALAARWLAG